MSITGGDLYTGGAPARFFSAPDPLLIVSSAVLLRVVSWRASTVFHSFAFLATASESRHMRIAMALLTSGLPNDVPAF